MSFIVRPAKSKDLNSLTDLTKQFVLLNLPQEKKVLSKKIEHSLNSFAGKISKDQAEYLFVVEDTEEQWVVGSSLVMAKHGTEDIPHSFFKIYKKNHYSEDLGIGFIHQVLKFQMDTDGPTEIGGLLVDKLYRRRPEKLGKQISLARFMYMATHPDRFEKDVICELTPPLTEDGRSEFWESLGRRFTGLSYQEADILSQTHKEFITSLFPDQDIYLCLLDTKARLALGRVGEQTKPAQHLLESIGFKYLEEVDPFDGGPHFGASTKNILPIQKGISVSLAKSVQGHFREQGLLCTAQDTDFKCVLVNYELQGNEIIIPEKSKKLLNVSEGESLFLSPFHYPQKEGEQV